LRERDIIREVGQRLVLAINRVILALKRVVTYLTGARGFFGRAPFRTLSAPPCQPSLEHVSRRDAVVASSPVLRRLADQPDRVALLVERDVVREVGQRFRGRNRNAPGAQDSSCGTDAWAVRCRTAFHPARSIQVCPAHNLTLSRPSGLSYGQNLDLPHPPGAGHQREVSVVGGRAADGEKHGD
jgi:hypothetical protein